MPSGRNAARRCDEGADELLELVTGQVVEIALAVPKLQSGRGLQTRLQVLAHPSRRAISVTSSSTSGTAHLLSANFG